METLYKLSVEYPIPKPARKSTLLQMAMAAAMVSG
jgi:hypothetical protein